MPARKRLDGELLGNLVTAAEIARRIGYTRPAVANWTSRELGFPRPTVGLLYDWRDVCIWLIATKRTRYIGVKFLPNIIGYTSSPTSTTTPQPAIANPVDDYHYPRRPWRPGGPPQ